MATLNLTELRKYEYRAPLLVDKVFKRNKIIPKLILNMIFRPLEEAVFICPFCIHSSSLTSFIYSSGPGWDISDFL